MFSRSTLNLKHALLAASIAAFAWAATPASSQQIAADNKPTADDGQLGAVIVTGTRVRGMTAADSATPITVLSTDTLTQGVGSTDLRQGLGQAIPSFTAQQFANDPAAMTLSAALRGLSPNDTLVMVDGKRRHSSATLHVLLDDFASGSAAPDISLIPTAAIDHVEVLLGGAAAQYGTDAIAGVVNFILKKKPSDGEFSATAGRDYDKGGDTYDFSFNKGMSLFESGFFNLTLDKKYHGFTQNGGPDSRLVDGPSNVPLTSTSDLGGVPLSVYQQVANYPRVNPLDGDSKYDLTMASFNAGYDVSDNAQLYGFGTYSHRIGLSFENYRLPNRALATPGSNQPCSAANQDGYNTAVDAAGNPTCALGVANRAQGGGVGVGPIPGEVGYTGMNNRGIIISSGNPGTYTSPNELIYRPYGFTPQEHLQEDDFQINVGLTTNVIGWDVDADVGFGKNIAQISVQNSANASLFLDTHFSPSNFNAGAFTASELVGTIDATRQFKIGLPSPLTVSFGTEARDDSYGITAGDEASTYKEGSQSYPGFLSTDAGTHTRRNYAGYVDLAVDPIEHLQVDVAGRAEHYSDFGNTQIGKFTTRYDFTPALAVRGTIANGFRAPTLQEEFYSATNVNPFQAVVQLPADSPAAKILGLPNLKPETSTEYSLGLIAHPAPHLTMTVDGYVIKLDNRIVPSSSVSSSGGSINTPLVNVAIAAHGNILDPTASQNGVSSFLNGISTETKGLDLTSNYEMDLDRAGVVNWTLAANYNKTTMTHVAPPPAVLLASNPGATFFDPSVLFLYENSAPPIKLGLTANWSLGPWGVTLRETYYGAQKMVTSQNGGVTLADFTRIDQQAVTFTDVELRYDVSKRFQIAAGGNNIFGVRPNTIPVLPLPNGFPADGGVVNNNPVRAAFNPNGGYYYGRIIYNF